MAKTASQVAVTQGSGVGLSTFDLATGRKRQTVVIGDADSTGEQALVELPAQHEPDRGSALKIGGRASLGIPGVVDSGDRVNAWFSVHGHLATMTTIMPAVIYDDGFRNINTQALPTTQVATSLVAAAPGLRAKLFSVYVVCSTFTTIGTAYLTDGSGGPTLLHLARILAVGQYPTLTTGLIMCQTSVNTPLYWNFDGGSANFGVHMSWYLAP